MRSAHRTHIPVGGIDALLPQTQCRQCGYEGCRPYAEAIAAGRAAINQCPPGGDDLARELAVLLGVAFRPLDAAYGVHKPPAVAVIDEETCIGCTLCIKACPVDAIVGAARLMHTVISAECTGCELCVSPCPVDCIHMQETSRLPTREERQATAARARHRFESRNRRLQREREDHAARRAASAATVAEQKKHSTIERAVARARARLQERRR